MGGQEVGGTITRLPPNMKPKRAPTTTASWAIAAQRKHKYQLTEIGQCDNLE